MAYGLPTIGGDDDTWGQELNDSITAVKDTADTASANATAAINSANEALSDAADALAAAEAAGAVESVAGRTGPVVLTKTDVGLANVDNTTDANKPVSTATTTALALKADATAVKFLLSGNLPGQVEIGDVVEGGIPLPSTVVLDRILLTTNVEPRGANLVVSVIKRTRSTGTESTLGTLTITANTGKRATLTGLGASFLTDDRLFLRVTQIGSSYSGSGLQFLLADTNTSFPTILSAPSAPSSPSAVASGGGDSVVVSWTAPASGAYHSVDVWREGGYLARVLKGSTSYDDSGADPAQDYDYDLRASNGDATSGTVSTSYTASSGIGGITEIGDGKAQAVSNTTVTITTTNTADVGDDVFVCLGGTVPTGSSETWTVTDSRGNTYATNVHAYDNTATQQAAIAHCRVSTGIQVADTITVTGTTATARLTAKAIVVSGISASTPLDEIQDNIVLTANATKNLNTTATAALAQADEFAIAAFSTTSGAPPITPGTGWSNASLVQTNQGSNDRALFVMWKITGATTAVTGTATSTVSTAFAGVVATYKGA